MGTSRSYYEEYVGKDTNKGNDTDGRSGNGRKTARGFGPKAGTLIIDCVSKLYRNKEHHAQAAAAGLYSAEECANRFYVDRLPSLKNVMEDSIDDGGIDDDHFTAYLLASISAWFAGLQDIYAESKAKDALRHRLGRDGRFVNVSAMDEEIARVKDEEEKKAKAASTRKKSDKGKDDKKKRTEPVRHRKSVWALADGPHTPSTVPESDLRLATLDYPFYMDPKAMQDTDRERHPNYGQPGQLQNMLEGVLSKADGAVDIDTLFRIVQYRVIVMQTPEVASMNTPVTEGGAEREYASAGISVEDQVIEGETNRDRRDYCVDLAELFEQHSKSWRDKYIKNHPEIVEELSRLGLDWETHTWKA